MVGRVVSVRTLGTRNAVCRCNLGGRVTPINLTFLIQVVLRVLYVVFIKYDKVCELSKHLRRLQDFKQPRYPEHICGRPEHTCGRPSNMCVSDGVRHCG